MICNYCVRLSIYEREHAPSFADLEMSAQSCWLCDSISRSILNRAQRETYDFSWPIRCRTVILYGAAGLEVVDAEHHRPLRVVGVYVVTNKGDTAESNGVPVKRQLTSTSSDVTFLTAKRWIVSCQLDHDCSSSTPFLRAQYESGYRPARMIDVCAFPDPSQDVRLVELDRPCQYVALSYSWGVDQFFVTSKDSLQSRLERIVYPELPKTFQDAVEITRKLGYRFLWIDALCIIQDSVSDWEEESQKMGVIYSQTVVTIAATSSASVHDGCFNRRSISQLSYMQNHMTVRSLTADGGPTELLFYELRNSPDVPMQIAGGALTRRGWACQERILSPRILHYTAEQIFWECRCHFHNEEGISENCSDRRILTAPSIVWRLTFRPDNATLFNRISMWYLDVIHEVYSARSLTRLSDRLPAIAGLARLIADDTSMTFLAGLWKEEIQFGLYWGVIRRAPRCQINVSPSWSWISYDTQVSWAMLIYGHFPPARFVLENFNVELTGQDPFGRVARASLNISGELCQVQVRLCPERSNRFTSVRDTMGDWSSELLDIRGRFLGDANLDREPGAETVYALLLATSAEPNGHDLEWNILLITPVSGRHNVFERIGIASIYQYFADIEPEWLQDFIWCSITLV